MTSWIHTRLWVLIGLLLLFGCQRYTDQPDQNPAPAPALGDLTIQLNDSGKGDLPTPLVQDLLDGALSLHLTKPRHGELKADLAAGRVIYTAGPDFRGTDTASYKLVRGSSTTGGLVIVKVAQNSCVVVANDDEFTLQVPFQRDYPLQALANDRVCADVRVTLLDLQGYFKVDSSKVLLNPPPGFNGDLTCEYELVATSGHRSRARILVHINACTLPFRAYDDSVQVPFFAPSLIYLDAILANDLSCPDSLDRTSFQILDKSPEVYLQAFDPTSSPLQLGVSVVPGDSLQSNRTFFLTYRIKDRAGRKSSEATVYIRRQR